MAMEKPVIATKLPGVMEEFGHTNGVLYVDRAEDTLKKAIELIENGCVGEEGRKARRFAKRHSWENLTDEFEEVLEKLV